MTELSHAPPQLHDMDYAYSANVEEFWRLVARIPHLKDVEERQRNLDHLDKLNAELEAMKR